MDENKNENATNLTEEEEGETTVLRAPDVADDDEEGATTVLTGPDPMIKDTPVVPDEKPRFEDKTQMVAPQGGQRPNGPMVAPMGQMPNGPMGAPMGQMPNGPMGAPMGQMPNGPM